MVRIRRFGVVRTATVIAVMYMLIVAVFAVPFVLLAAAVGGPIAAARGVPFDIGGIVLLALVAIFAYGLVGWLFTAIACAFYNLAARWAGGIELQLVEVAPPAPLPAWTAAPPVPPVPPVSTERGSV